MFYFSLLWHTSYLVYLIEPWNNFDREDMEDDLNIDEVYIPDSDESCHRDCGM